MQIPDDCVVLEQIKEDGDNPEQLWPLFAKNLTHEEVRERLSRIGIDSLSAIEYADAAKSCDTCDGGQRLNCALGNFLLQL